MESTATPVVSSADVSAMQAMQAQMAQMHAMFLAQQQAPANVQVAPTRAAARTVGVLWEAYLKSFAKGVPSWARRTTKFLQKLVFEYEDEEITLWDRPWTSLTPQMGLAWWDQLCETEAGIGTPNGRGSMLSAGYRNRIKTALSGCFTHHMDLSDRADSRVRSDITIDSVTENPIHRWPRAKKNEVGKRMAGFANELEFAEFCKHAHPQLVEMMTLSVWCGGMRANEVRELRWAFVDFAAKMIRLPGWFVKNGVARSFPVKDACIAILERHRATRRSEFVFPSPDLAGHAVGKTTMENWVREARRSWGHMLNGNEKVVFHHCRHTFAKWSLLFGDADSTVMQFGGWQSFDVFKGYAEINEAMIEKSRANKNRSVQDAIDEAAGKVTAPTQRRSAQRSSRHEVRTREATTK